MGESVPARSGWSVDTLPVVDLLVDLEAVCVKPGKSEDLELSGRYWSVAGLIKGFEETTEL